MIKSFFNIGEQITTDLTDGEKLDKLMIDLMIEPEKNNTKSNTTNYEVVLNLDTKRNEIELKLGRELNNEYKEDFYAFESAPRGKRIFFSSNNLYYLNTLMPDLKYYIEKNSTDIEFLNEEKNEMLQMIGRLDNIFYNKNPDKDERIINIDLFKSKQKKEIKKFLNDNQKGKYEKVLRSAIEEYIESNLIGNNKYKDITIFSLTVDDKYINEIDLFNSYKKIIQYNQFKKDIVDEEYKDKICSCCGQRKTITPKINFPTRTKIYVTTGKNFFYNRSDSKSARLESFAICEECYTSIYIGMLYCIGNFNYRLLDDYQMKFILVPKNISDTQNLKRTLDFIPRLFSRKSYDLESQKKLIKDVMNYSKKKNIRLDFNFYELNAQSTGIRIDDSINDVPFERIASISKDLFYLNDQHTNLSYKNESKVTLNFAYHNMFKIRATNALIKKELISFFSSVLKGRSLSYRYLLRLFLRNYKGSIYDKKSKEYSIFSIYEMQLFMTWLNNICGLKGGFMKEENGSGYYEIEYPQINEYFKVHEETFKNNHRRGLFFIGLLINEVLRQQKSKSTNFMSKIKYEGLKTRDVRKLILELTKYLEMYRPVINGDRVSLTKLNSKIYGYMTDLLLDIDESTLTKDENLFYILSGVSFARNVNYKSKEESEEIAN